MTQVVYHIQNGTANITSCFVQNIDEKAIYGKLKADIGKYLRRLCEYKGVEIVEAHAMIDHIHMLVKIPPKLAVRFIHGISQREE